MGCNRGGTSFGSRRLGNEGRGNLTILKTLLNWTVNERRKRWGWGLLQCGLVLHCPNESGGQQAAAQKGCCRGGGAHLAARVFYGNPPGSARLPSLTQNDASFTGCLMLSPTASFSEENHFSSHKWWNRKLGPTPATVKIGLGLRETLSHQSPPMQWNTLDHLQ